MQWSFRKQSPGEITRDPIIGEFFSTEAIENPAEALVREGIQNALDAKIEPAIRVRIFLGNGKDALGNEKVSLWFNGIWDHLYVKGNGLREVPDNNDSCPYLVFEDFGTTGLQGNIHQLFDEPNNKNSFFYFFRAEGRSAKGETDRGRWGIGKHVFSRSSRISTYFGLSVRSDDGTHLLMGHTILKSHKMNGSNYAPDGYFGESNQDNAFILPITDKKVLNRFSKDFHLSRNDEPGLSIAVPFVDTEITVQHLKHAVIAGYFYPILKGELVVDVEATGEIKSRIDTSTLLSEIASLEDDAKSDLVSLVGFADWIVHNSIGKEYILNPCTLEAPAWSSDMIPQEIFEKIRNDLDTGKSIALHVGLKITQKGKKPIMSYFNVYLRQDGYKSGRPVFIREGIIISDIHAPRSPGVRSVVVVEDKPLATLLGDSENPAHTQWQKDSSNFKDKYTNGKNYIEFVTRIVSNIVSALAARENQKDPYLFADIFSLPLDEIDDEDNFIDTPQPKGGETTGGKPQKINRQEKPYQIARINGGFKIIPSDLEIEPKTYLRVLVAYDLRKGNPLKKYSPSDFEIGKPPIKYNDSQRGITVINVEENQILFEVTHTNFQLVVSGFDQRRDLFVKVEEVSSD